MLKMREEREGRRKQISSSYWSLTVLNFVCWKLILFLGSIISNCRQLKDASNSSPVVSLFVFDTVLPGRINVSWIIYYFPTRDSYPSSSNIFSSFPPCQAVVPMHESLTEPYYILTSGSPSSISQKTLNSLCILRPALMESPEIAF